MSTTRETLATGGRQYPHTQPLQVGHLFLCSAVQPCWNIPVIQRAWTACLQAVWNSIVLSHKGARHTEQSSFASSWSLGRCPLDCSSFPSLKVVPTTNHVCLETVSESRHGVDRAGSGGHDCRGPTPRPTVLLPGLARGAGESVSLPVSPKPSYHGASFP